MAKTTQAHEDARIKKTKEKLFSKFSEILSTKPFEEITVNEICAEAGVRRATFYKHFTDKYDFLAMHISTLIEQFENEKRSATAVMYDAEYHISFVRELMHYLADNEDAVNLIINSNMGSTLINIIVKEIHKNVTEWLKLGKESGARTVASDETVAFMLSGGIATVIVQWFAGDRARSISELTDEIADIVKSMFVRTA